MGNFRCSISFLCHRLPILGKSMGLLPIGFPHIGKHMGTNTTQCTIGFPEVKLHSHRFPIYGPHMVHRYAIGLSYVVIS